jgi:hypothetical protein
MLNYINSLASASPRIACLYSLLCSRREERDIVYNNPKYEPDSVYSEEFKKFYLSPQNGTESLQKPILPNITILTLTINKCVSKVLFFFISHKFTIYSTNGEISKYVVRKRLCGAIIQ